MTIASDINSDLANMLSDWGDTITIGGTTYNGIYESEYVEVLGMEGFKPVFTGATSDFSAVARGADATVTSVIGGITDKAFTVAQPQDQRDGTTKLLLNEA